MKHATLKEKKHDIGISPKAIDIEDGTYLYFWYANNRGRGDNNVTIIRSKSPIRAALSRTQNGIVATTLTSGWRGHVNFSKAVRGYLGLDW